MDRTKQPIYMDYNSTTPVDKRVVEKMLPYFTQFPGNAASRSHAYGWIAEEAVDQARSSIADLISVNPEEIVFTSGATESDNLALKGIFELYHRKGQHIITSQTEHNAVLDACRNIEKRGGEITYLEVNEDGLINLTQLADAIRQDTILVSIMWANNETGVIQPMEEIGKICAENNVLLMSDATQAVGKILVEPKKAGVHLMAFTAHKMYGPKGVGALYVSKRNPRVKLSAQIDGGGHEKGVRSGTLNVPGIVGFGAAAKLASESLDQEYARISTLQQILEQHLLQEVEGAFLNGKKAPRLPNTTNIGFLHTEAENLIMTFRDEIAAASGSACSSASLDPSHVLIAMGLSESQASSSIRLSMGRYTQKKDIDLAIEAVKTGIEKIRSQSPVWSMFKQGLLE